jgi:hypothetical protein
VLTLRPSQYWRADAGESPDPHPRLARRPLVDGTRLPPAVTPGARRAKFRRSDVSKTPTLT